MADPLTFDHPLDHVPGLALVESAAAAAERLTSGITQAFSFRFHRFTEFSPATIVRAEFSPSGDIAVEMIQEDHHVMSGWIRAERQREPIDSGRR